MKAKRVADRTITESCPSCRRPRYACALDPCTAMRPNERFGKTCECGCGESVRVDRRFRQGHSPSPSERLAKSIGISEQQKAATLARYERMRLTSVGKRLVKKGLGSDRRTGESRVDAELRLLCSQQHEEMRRPNDAHYPWLRGPESLDGEWQEYGDWRSGAVGAVWFDREDDRWPYDAAMHARAYKHRGQTRW